MLPQQCDQSTVLQARRIEQPPHGGERSITRSNITATNALRGRVFVFLYIDAFGGPFIDVALDARLNGDTLAGTVRVTTRTPENRDHFTQPRRETGKQ